MEKMVRKNKYFESISLFDSQMVLEMLVILVKLLTTNLMVLYWKCLVLIF